MSAAPSSPLPTPPTDTGGLPDSWFGALQPVLPDLSVGAVLGFATGMAIKAVGRVVLVVVGVLFITLQLLAYFEVVSIDWLRLQGLTEPWLRQGGEHGLEWLGRVLTANLPFAGAFAAGLALGLRSRL